MGQLKLKCEEYKSKFDSELKILATEKSPYSKIRHVLIKTNFIPCLRRALSEIGEENLSGELLAITEHEK